MSKRRIKEVLASPGIGSEVTITGWVRTRRDSKAGFSFIEVNDGSCLKSIQVVADATLPNYESAVKALQTGASVVVQGTLVESAGAGQSVEVRASAVTLVGDGGGEEYPLQKKRHSFEFLREMGPPAAAVEHLGRGRMRVRNRLALAIHEFFQARGFSTSTRRSSPPAIARVPARCSR
jgi:asparaginyl-tRNA synthetase